MHGSRLVWIDGEPGRLYLVTEIRSEQCGEENQE